MNTPGAKNVGQAFLPAQSATQISRRRLPHWTREGVIYWITFRLADSLPQEKLRQWRDERDRWIQLNPEPWSDQQWHVFNTRFGERLDQWLDAGYGSRALAQPEVRATVRDCLLRFDDDRLSLHAAVIMPNHVHLLLEPLDGNALAKLLQGIKGASARNANRILGTTGSFWLDESYDHIVRSEAQYLHFMRYIEDNPVKAGLHDHAYWLYMAGQTRMSAPP